VAHKLQPAGAVSEPLSREELVKFFSVLSHDLKSPIFTIDGFSDLLLSDAADKLDEESQDFLQRIRGAAQQMKTVIDEMSHMVKLLSRPDAVHDIDLNDLLGEIRLKCNNLLDEGKVEIEVEGSLPTVSGDREKIREAFTALIANALTFTDQPPGQRTVRIESSTTEGQARVCVIDNGIGMDPRYTHQVFELGLKLDKSRGPGAGYGLYMAKKVIESHGGTLTVESAVGEGSRFCVTLPAAG
jgi:signal transduction histidine kinase